MVKGSKTKICLDIKSITKPTTHHAESVKACQRACEIIVAMGAQNFCEFICSGYEDIVKNCAKYANAAGITPKEYVDGVAAQIKGVWDCMNTTYDRFIRTTDTDHENQVKKIFKKLYEQGDIYKSIDLVQNIRKSH